MLSYLRAKLESRLKRVRSSGKKKLNWIFLPGGPGLGSETIAPLTSILKLPGTIWHLDLPGDGSNLRGSFKNWKPALLEAVQALDNVILVGHSTGGMLALATPELQYLLKGLILKEVISVHFRNDRDELSNVGLFETGRKIFLRSWNPCLVSTKA
jgi:pimeloyl-ACP methyl ester carboxylesterase